MATFALLSALVSLAAAFSLISHRFLRLPAAVGVVLLALLTATLLVVSGPLIPGIHAQAAAVIAHIDFSTVVLHGMLGFLLFAGSLKLDLRALGRQKAPVISLSVIGTMLSTVFVAALLKVIFSVTGFGARWITCLLFGALISPTDPIAVLEMLRRVGAPSSLEAQLTGESLFNDGVGAVLFLTLFETYTRGIRPTFGGFSWLLLVKAGGGILLGLGLGYIVYRLLRLVDSYRVEVLLTLALAMGGYALADNLHLSAPLEAVAAGLIAGGRARDLAMSPLTRDNVDRFWELVDDILNVLLFLLLGLELLAMPWNRHYLYAGLLTIPVVLAARWLSVVVSLFVIRPIHKPAAGAITVLTWGGLRGGLAVALALSLAPGGAHDRLIATTYMVVIFSILVQGLTMDRLLRSLGFAAPRPPVLAGP